MTELLNTAEIAFELFSALKANNYTFCSAESCTGGNIGKVMTDMSGVSSVYLGSVCAYANEIKQKILSVSPDTLEKFGAVSEQTAYELAKNVKEKFSSDLSVSTTGIAGPTGDTPTKPVGLVYIGVAFEDKVSVKRYVFSGDRATVRNNATYQALSDALEIITSKK